MRISGGTMGVDIAATALGRNWEPDGLLSDLVLIEQIAAGEERALQLVAQRYGSQNRIG